MTDLKVYCSESEKIRASCYIMCLNPCTDFANDSNPTECFIKY